MAEQRYELTDSRAQDKERIPDGFLRLRLETHMKRSGRSQDGRRRKNRIRRGIERLEHRQLLAVFAVNQTTDASDATSWGDAVVDTDLVTPGQQISLRAAIQEANILPGRDTIQLPSGSFHLHLVDEVDALGGDLDIADELLIEGVGVGATVIDGGRGDRIFEIHNGNVELHDLTVFNGLVEQADGGAIRQHGANVLRIERSSIQENEVLGGFGGGIYVTGRLELVDTTIRDNLSEIGGYGGGIFAHENTDVIIQRSTISGNRVDQDGGGLFMEGGILTVDSSTFSGNFATEGGGLRVGAKSVLEVTDSTIAFNEAIRSGGVHTEAVSTTIGNTIIGKNSVSDSAPDIFGVVSSLGNNLIQDDSEATISPSGRDLIGVDPILGGLADNGGLTETHALLVGSPAIDTGVSAAVVDQRGLPRTTDGDLDGVAVPDIGAHEFQGTFRASQSFPIEIDNSQTVPFATFNVLVPGTITLEVEWAGESELAVELQGRRRTHLADPTTSYATSFGSSPLRLTYGVTEEDLARGVSWRAVARDRSDISDASGTMTISVPYHPAVDAQFQNEKVPLRGADLWPSDRLNQVFVDELHGRTSGGLHGILTITKECTCYEAYALEQAGFFRQDFVTQRHSIGFVRHDADFGVPVVQNSLFGLTPIDPEDKIDPHILVGNYEYFEILVNGERITADFEIDNTPIGRTNSVLQSDGSLDLVVGFHDDTHVRDMLDILAREANNYSSYDANTWRVNLEEAQLIRLAEHPQVSTVSSGGLPVLPDTSTTRQAINVDDVQGLQLESGVTSFEGVTGNGVTIGIYDNGINADHPDLNVTIDRFLADITTLHGTHVAGIAAGSGLSSSRPQNGMAPPLHFRGMAPDASLIDGHGGTFMTLTILDDVRDGSLDVANISQTTNTTGRYENFDSFIDDFVRGDSAVRHDDELYLIEHDLPRRPVVYSAGNNGSDDPIHGDLFGYFSITKQNKNAIVVGNWEIVGAPDAHGNLTDDLLRGRSSMGPTSDGRIKPDVVAPGTEITSTSTNGRNEIQLIQFAGGVPTTGSFTVTFNGETTEPIDFDASPGEVELALEQLNGIFSPPIPGLPHTSPAPFAGVTVTMANNGYLVEFLDRKGDVPQLTTNDIGFDVGRTVVTTEEEGLADYDVVSGTSQAAPAVSGVVALMLEAWQETYLNPVNATIDAVPPLPSTLRALLINTATDIVGTGPNNEVRNNTSADILDASGNPNGGTPTATVGPDFATGWGLVNAEAAVTMLTDSFDLPSGPIPKQIVEDEIVQGQIVEFDFVVSHSEDLKFTLAWDDAQGSVNRNDSLSLLVNDLDLELRDPNDKPYYPWQLGHTIHSPGGQKIPPEQQMPGTPIVVRREITPTPKLISSVESPLGTENPFRSALSSGFEGQDQVPLSALTGTGAWVARKGRDHLNNIEQVVVDEGDVVTGRWTARVSGFSVTKGPQDFSLVGFPGHDVADLAVQAVTRVDLEEMGRDLEFTWSVTNQGTGNFGAGEDGFNYQIVLSDDFQVDGDDVVITDITSFGPDSQRIARRLDVGETISHNSTVRISSADAARFGASSAAELADMDVFLLVQVDSDGEILELNEVNTTSVQIARPVDVVFVFDRSGSMGADVRVTGADRKKIDQLRDAASLFLDLMRNDGDDGLAQVSFSGDARVDSGATGLPRNALATMNSEAAFFNARQDIAELDSGGWTDLLEALQLAEEIQTVDPSADGRRKIVVFFSDGMHTEDGDPLSALPSLQAAGVQVYSVGFGTEGATDRSGIDVQLLQALASVGDESKFAVTSDPLELNKFFVDALAGATRRDVIVDPFGLLHPTEEATVPIIVNSQDKKVTFTVTWDTPRARLETRVRTPGGHLIDLNQLGGFGGKVSRVRGPQGAETYEHVTIDLPLPIGMETEHGGIWEMLVHNQADGGGSAARYSASAISDSTIHLEFPAPKPAGDGFAVGEPMPLSARLTGFKNVPIRSATVTATPIVPSQSIGDFLASHVVPPSILSRVETHHPGGEPLTDQERLYTAVVREMEIAPPKRIELPPMELSEASPGHFTGSFSNTMTEGTYSFLVRTTGFTDDCEMFQREVSQSAARLPSLVAGRPKVTPEPDGSGIIITVQPKTGGGALVGPGLGGQFEILADSLEPSSELVDHGDGTYSQSFEANHDVGSATLKIGQTDPVNLDLRAPIPSTVAPAGIGRQDLEDGSAQIVVTLDDPIVPSQLDFEAQAITLIDGDYEFLVEDLDFDSDSNSLSLTLPPDLPPGQYDLRIETNVGSSPTNSSAMFQVIGDGPDFPIDVLNVGEAVTRLLHAAGFGETQLAIGSLISQLNLTDEGWAANAVLKGLAYDQLFDLQTKNIDFVDAVDIPHVLSWANALRVDARFADFPAVFTAQGDEVEVRLGNQVRVTYPNVEASGTSWVEFASGPNEFVPSARGIVHTTYQLHTTAQLDDQQPVFLELGFDEQDFVNSDQVRMLQLVDSEWVDVGADVDEGENLVFANILPTLPFVLVQGDESPIQDFGDAAASFGTQAAANGARHGLNSGEAIRLGGRVDSEPDGVPSASADSDDGGGQSDEDGVRLLHPLVAGEAAEVDIEINGSGFLSAWVDFNRDDVWTADDQIFSNLLVDELTETLSFLVPQDLANEHYGSTTTARFRVSTQPIESPHGYAADGEVEDHLFAVAGLWDFDGDGLLGCSDLTLLYDHLDTAGPMVFDVLNDNRVDRNDISYWIRQIAGGTPGDVNLDGSVDTEDLSVWRENVFTETPGWCNADLNLDGYIDVSDFNQWNAHRFTVVNALAADRPSRHPRQPPKPAMAVAPKNGIHLNPNHSMPRVTANHRRRSRPTNDLTREMGLRVEYVDHYHCTAGETERTVWRSSIMQTTTLRRKLLKGIAKTRACASAEFSVPFTKKGLLALFASEGDFGRP